MRKRIENARDKLLKAKIDWETDIDKMHFENLRADYNLKISYTDLELSKIKVDYTDNINYTNFDDLLSFREHPENMLNLVEFIISKKKVIPPMYVSNCEIINGVKNKDPNILLHDGNHRTRVAQYLGLLEIPIVINNWNARFTFSLSEVTMIRCNNFDVVWYKDTAYHFAHHKWHIEPLTNESITFHRVGRTTFENGKMFADYT